MERILEKGANASAAASVWPQETGKEEDWRVVVDVIGHLRDMKNTEIRLCCGKFMNFTQPVHFFPL